MTLSVGDIVVRLDDAFPFEWAEPWDNVGLVVGDPDAPVTGVTVALDADVPTLERAIEAGANVLVTHHPPFLEIPEQVSPASAPVLWHAAANHLAIISAHTNLDRSPLAAGVLLRELGLDPGDPIENSLAQEVLVAIYAPIDAAEQIRGAIARTGAGRISEYDACSFTGQGEGRFLPRETATPRVDPTGPDARTLEVRIEAVSSQSKASRVLAAARTAHPYEEPLITVSPVERHRGSVALGRVADIPATTLGELVSRVSTHFDCSPRVWGDPRIEVARLATATGSAGSLVGASVRSGANVLLAGEVRYHDALDAIHAGLAIIEAGHDVTEWPLVPILAREIRLTPGLDEGLLTVESATRGWWTP